MLKKSKSSKESKDPNTVLTDNYINLYLKYKIFVPAKNTVNAKIPANLVYPFCVILVNFITNDINKQRNNSTHAETIPTSATR